MAIDSSDDLIVRRHERLEDAREKHNALLHLVESHTMLDSPDLLIERTPWGVIPTVNRPSGTGFVSPIFRARVETKDANTALVSFGRGLVGGLEPKIGDRLISDTTQQRPVPQIEVGKNAFDKDGIARIYVELSFANNWTIQSAVIVASAKKLGDQPWKAHDLLGLLLNNGGSFRYQRFTFFNHGHIAVQRQPNGIARHLFFAA